MNKLVKYIFPLLVSFNVFLSCNQDENNSTPELTYIEGQKVAIPTYDGYNINYRHPIVYNYQKDNSYHTAIYLIRQDDPFWIDKYENLDGKTIKVDSIKVPSEVFMGMHQNINEFGIIGIDSFIVQPSYMATNGENIFFEFSENHIKKYTLPNVHNNKKFIVANMNMNPINFKGHIGVGRLMYIEGAGTAEAFVDTVCKYNALVKFNFDNSEIEFFDEYDEILCDRKIENIFIQLKLRLLQDDRIVTLSPFKQEFHIFEKNEKRIIPFNFEEFDEHYFGTKDTQKEMWVNDYFISLIYNPLTHKYYVLMFEGDDYIEPDEFIKKPKQKRKYTILVFNEQLSIEGKINFNDTISNMYTGRLFPSPRGIFLRKQLKDKYEIQEFIIQ